MNRPFLLRPGADDAVLPPNMELGEYVKLRDQWYRRLKAQGFEDIEFGICAAGVRELPWPTGTVSSAKRRTARDVNVPVPIDEERSAADFHDNYTYWALCRQFLNSQSRNRPKRRERRVWALHCEGLKGREISRRLRLNKNTVQRILHRVEAAMWTWWHATERVREEELALRTAAEEVSNAT